MSLRQLVCPPAEGVHLRTSSFARGCSGPDTDNTTCHHDGWSLGPPTRYSDQALFSVSFASTSDARRLPWDTRARSPALTLGGQGTALALNGLARGRRESRDHNQPHTVGTGSTRCHRRRRTDLPPRSLFRRRSPRCLTHTSGNLTYLCHLTSPLQAPPQSTHTAQTSLRVVHFLAPPRSRPELLPLHTAIHPSAAGIGRRHQTYS